MGKPEPKQTTDRLPAADRPVQDEWGLFDPEQAGLAAVLRKLNESKSGDKATPKK